MRHDISTTAALSGSGAWAGNQARAIFARHATAADAFFSYPPSCCADTDVLRPMRHGFNNRACGLRLTTERSARWSNINDNAYAYRRAAPGRNPGRGRHREPDRGA